MEKEDGNISTTSGHKTQFNLEAYPSSTAQIPLRWSKVGPYLVGMDSIRVKGGL